MHRMKVLSNTQIAICAFKLLRFFFFLFYLNSGREFFVGRDVGKDAFYVLQILVYEPIKDNGKISYSYSKGLQMLAAQRTACILHLVKQKF